jgi:hypothetical protein
MFEWSWTEATQDLWRSGHFLLTNKKTLVISLHIKSLAKIGPKTEQKMLTLLSISKATW